MSVHKLLKYTLRIASSFLLNKTRNSTPKDPSLKYNLVLDITNFVAPIKSASKKN